MNPEDSDVLADEIGGPVERIWLEKSFHVATLDYDQAEVESATRRLRPARHRRLTHRRSPHSGPAGRCACMGGWTSPRSGAAGTIDVGADLPIQVFEPPEPIPADTGVPLPPDSVGYRLKRKLPRAAAAHRRARAPAARQADGAGGVRVRQPLVVAPTPPRRSSTSSSRPSAWPPSRSSCRSPSPWSWCWLPDPLATGRRSRRTRRPAAPTSSPATTSASCPRRSPARRCSSTTSSPCRCRSSAGTAALVSAFERARARTGCRSRSSSSPSSRTATCAA